MSSFQIDDPFDLPVEYNGTEIILPARLVKRGYSYKIHIEFQGQEMIFEPDEERNFRAMIENPNANRVPIGMIRAIGEALEKHLR